MALFDKREKRILAEICQKYPIVAKKGYCGQIISEKRQAWVQICEEFNALNQGNPARDCAQLRVGNMDFSDLNWEKTNYNPTVAYGRSKLANILFTKELAKRLEGTGVTSYTLHPGAVATELGRHYDTAYFKGVSWLFNNIAKYFIKSPLQGAQTTIYCAVSEKAANESGCYYSGCSKYMTTQQAQNPELAERLWEESIKLVGLDNWDPVTATEIPDLYLHSSAVSNELEQKGMKK